MSMSDTAESEQRYRAFQFSLFFPPVSVCVSASDVSVDVYHVFGPVLHETGEGKKVLTFSLANVRAGCSDSAADAG